jgi:SSS family solute:Na+ symporter
MLLTAPESEETLLRFYRKVRPGGSLWKPIAGKAPDIITDQGLGWDLLDWAVGIILIYTALFGIGKIILGLFGTGLLLLFISILCFLFIKWELNRRGWPVLKVNEEALD